MSDIQPFSLFGYGEAGLPGEIDILFAGDGVDVIAQEVIVECRREVQRRLGKDAHARRSADDRLAMVNTLAYALIAWHAKLGKPAPEIVLQALAEVLGLISPTGESLAAATVRKRLGIPIVKKIGHFLEASRLDGEAEARGEKLPVDALARQVGVERATIRAWRQMPTYQRRRAIAGMAPRVYAKWNKDEGSGKTYVPAGVPRQPAGRPRKWRPSR